MDRFQESEILASLGDFVKEVSPDKFWQKKYSIKEPFQEIETDTWIEGGLNTRMLNYGAGPCLIVFAIDRNAGRLISGHFSVTNRKVYESRIATSVDEDLIEKAYVSFSNMTKRLKAWVDEKSYKNINTYLYGQNFGAYRPPGQIASGIISDTTEHQDVIQEFSRNTDIPINAISDYRKPGSDKTDSIMYLPEDGILYHTSR